MSRDINPEIIILCGVPCSGKSTWANTYQEIHGHAIISRDDIREEFWEKYSYTDSNEARVTKIFDRYLRQRIECSHDIILDNTHCSEKYLDAEIKRKPVGYTLRIMFFNCPLWLAHYRNIIRWATTGKYIPIKVINNMKKNYDKIQRDKYDLYM